jgi:hypothetical protein
MANSLIVIAGLLFLGTTALLIWARGDAVDFFDLMVVMWAMEFGAYPLSQVGSAESHQEPGLLIASVLFPATLVLLLWLTSKTLGRPSGFEIRPMIPIWCQADSRSLMLILVGVFTFIVYGLLRFHLLGMLMAADPAEVKTLSPRLDSDQINQLAEQALPYWFSSLHMLIETSVILPVFLMTSSKALLSPSRRLRLGWWIVLAVVFVVLGMLRGRRPVIIFTLLLITMSSVSKGRNPLSLKNLGWFAMGLPVVVICSNIYQNTRLLLPYVWDMGPLTTITYMTEHMFDNEQTVQNLRKRSSPAWLEYVVLDKQENEHRGIGYGVLLWTNVEALIPRVFEPNKEVASTKDILADSYSLPHTDYDNSLASEAQFDFGNLCFLIVPVLMLPIFMLDQLLLRLTRKHPLLFATVSGGILQSFLAVEGSYSNHLSVLRTLLIIYMSFVVWRVLISFYHYRGPRGSWEQKEISDFSDKWSEPARP